MAPFIFEKYVKDNLDFISNLENKYLTVTNKKTQETKTEQAKPEAASFDLSDLF